MAHVSANCIYIDQHDTGHENNRTYEAIEVDKETRRKDFKIFIYSLGLICSLIIFAMLFLNVIKFNDSKDNFWDTLVPYTCYFVLFILTILFIYAIAKADFRVKSNKSTSEYNEHINCDLEKQCSFNSGMAP